MTSSAGPPLDIWRGELVRLRAVEPGDEHTMLTEDDSENQRLSHLVHFPSSTAAAREWAVEQSQRSEGDCVFLVVERLSDRALAGTISVPGADRRHGRFSLGLALYRQYWRQRLGSDAARLVLRYYFTELRYEKCEVDVYEFNDASLSFFRALGFVEEGRRRSSLFTRGRRWDVVLLGMTVEEFAAAHPAYAELLADRAD